MDQIILSLPSMFVELSAIGSNMWGKQTRKCCVFARILRSKEFSQFKFVGMIR